MVDKINLGPTNEFLNSLGNPGKYQTLALILCFLNYLTLAFGHMAMALYGWTPLHHCNLFEENSTLSPNENYLYSWNTTNNQNEYQCYIYETHSKELLSCRDANGWNYSGNGEYTSIVMEWDLVCDQKYLAALATSLYFVGVLIGGFTLGALADKYGRKTILMVSVSGMLVFGTGAGLSQSFAAFVVLRILQGFFMQGMKSGTYIMTSEMLVPRWRTTLTPVLHTAWGAGLAWMALIAYIFKDWHYIQIALGLHHVLNLLTFLFIEESLRWLIASGRKERAVKVYTKICKWNHLQYSEAELMKCFDIKEDEAEHSTSPVGLLDIAKSPVLRKRTFIVAYIWICSTTIYYGLSLKVTPLIEDKHINFLIMGLLEIIVYVILIFAVRRFQRKITFWFLYVPVAFFCLIVGLSPENTENGIDITKFVLACAILGRLFVSGVFAVINLYVAELYPTVLRTLGLGIAHSSSRLGAILAPQLLLLGSYTFETLPTLLFAVFATGACIIVIFLPETFNQPLLDTIDDIEKTNQAKKKIKFTSTFFNCCIRKKIIKHSIPEEQILPLNKL